MYPDVLVQHLAVVERDLLQLLQASLQLAELRQSASSLSLDVRLDLPDPLALELDTLRDDLLLESTKARSTDVSACPGSVLASRKDEPLVDDLLLDLQLLLQSLPEALDESSSLVLDDLLPTLLPLLELIAHKDLPLPQLTLEVLPGGFELLVERGLLFGLDRGEAAGDGLEVELGGRDERLGVRRRRGDGRQVLRQFVKGSGQLGDDGVGSLKVGGKSREELASGLALGTRSDRLALDVVAGRRLESKRKLLGPKSKALGVLGGGLDLLGLVVEVVETALERILGLGHERLEVLDTLNDLVLDVVSGVLGRVDRILSLLLEVLVGKGVPGVGDTDEGRVLKVDRLLLDLTNDLPGLLSSGAQRVLRLVSELADLGLSLVGQLEDGALSLLSGLAELGLGVLDGSSGLVLLSLGLGLGSSESLRRLDGDGGEGSSGCGGTVGWSRGGSRGGGGGSRRDLPVKRRGSSVRSG